MNNEKEDVKIQLSRLEQKIDRLQQFLNNDYNELSEEMEKMNKNFFSLEVMFYIVVAILVLLIVLTVI